MILIVTNHQDLTTDYIVRELDRRSIPYVRVNTGALGSASVVLHPDCPEEDALTIEGQHFRLADVTAAYFRRPETPTVPEGIGNEAVRAYCVAEWSAVLKNLIGRMEGLWFNDPNMINFAEDKPRQLRIANRIGFRVPKTVITNDPLVARTFVGSHQTVAKPLRQALLEDEGLGRVMFTSRINEGNLGADDSIAAAPVIFQNEIIKDVDLRVTIVDQTVFAVAIHSQIEEETKVDWRRGVRPDLKHEVVELPAEIQRKCVQITKALNLRFGAIDLVRDKAGKYWFLEINPNGQWAWIENRTGLEIARAIVNALTTASSNV